jgi:polyisoprenoid-binding protein YceI
MRQFHPSEAGLKCILGAILAVSFAAVSFARMPQTAQGADEREELIVFVQSGTSPVGDAFRSRYLPEIYKIADEMGLDVHVVEARNGSPEEVSVTPLIVFQNYRGRSIYQGRTNTLERIRNFIRTSRFIPQGNAPNRRENIPLWIQGRTRTWAPVKVTGLTGQVPHPHDPKAFAAESLDGIYEGFDKFKLQTNADLGRADRGFYMDFHPYLSGDGTLYLSLALFSQFDCKKPVFESKIYGPWKDRRQLFRQAAGIQEKKVAEIIGNPADGDSFDPVSENTPGKSWEEIGYPLPETPPKKQSSAAIELAVPIEWIFVKSDPNEPPMIQFRFPAPLDHYSGEVTDGSGGIVLAKSRRLDDGATGSIEIDTRTAVTMGNPLLDEAIRGSMMLDSKNHPKATFVIESIKSSGQPIAFGELIPAGINGTFTLKGKSIPLTSAAEFEIIVGEDNAAALLIRSAFRIDLRTFEIEGADGPEPARYTLLFDANFKMKAAESRLRKP